MRRDRFRIAAFLLCACAGTRVVAQQPTADRVQLSGYIRDAGSREVIRYALVDTDGDSVRTRSNTDGFYFLSLSPGSHRLRVRAIGYAPLDTTIAVAESRTWDVTLISRPVSLQRVQVPLAFAHTVRQGAENHAQQTIRTRLAPRVVRQGARRRRRFDLV